MSRGRQQRKKDSGNVGRGELESFFFVASHVTVDSVFTIGIIVLQSQAA